MFKFSVTILAPVPQPFTYLHDAPVASGCRVMVPFGKNNLSRIGIVCGCQPVGRSFFQDKKLKRIERVLDTEPLWTPDAWRTLLFAAEYYFTPLGQVLQAALPKFFRDSARCFPATPIEETFIVPAPGYTKTQVCSQLARAPRQQEVVEMLFRKGEIQANEILSLDLSKSAVKALIDRNLAHEVQRHLPLHGENWQVQEQAFHVLSATQEQAVQALRERTGNAVDLLYGVTGSGKTEVFLQRIADVVRQSRQALILLPEIGLTPQQIKRVATRFQCPTVALHSGLSDSERAKAWRMAGNGQAAIVIGTRSSVFVPMHRLGLIIVDEEHDHSFKQDSAFAYHGRDLAIYRAHQANVPVILASATPSAESLVQVRNGKYGMIRMNQRAGGASMPPLNLLDTRNTVFESGLASNSINLIHKHLQQKGQVLVYLGRRGWAPILQCAACGWAKTCSGCDRPMTFHNSTGRCHCHICGTSAKNPSTCPGCHCERLTTVGIGTQQLTSALQRLFPGARVMRMDSDSMAGKEAMDKAVTLINSGDVDIVVCTQIAKGHNWDKMTLCITLNTDTFLFNQDYRAEEELGQLLIQVGGRVGRAHKPGEVYIQTNCVDHPLMKAIATGNYDAVRDYLLANRQGQADDSNKVLPPFSRCAHLEIYSTHEDKAKHLLLRMQSHLESENSIVFGEVSPTPIRKIRGMCQMKLPIYARDRQSLHQVLKKNLALLKNLAVKQEFRINIDPL